MAANFDREALRIMGDQASDEARAIYNHEIENGNYGKQYKGLTFWTPNINIFRDPRWGRGQETYGEDPYLTGELGSAIVEGLEGTDDKYLKVSACAKHYAVHSGPEYSRHVYDAEPTPYDLWNTYLPAFEKLVVDAEVTSVMCAYNRFEGEPCCGSDNLMINILRNRWGFTGYVTSDCGAVNDFWLTHKTEPNAESAAAKSIQSGTDLECGAEWSKLWTYNSLGDAVEQGLLDEAKLDESLCRLFEIRMRLGMFDEFDEVPYNHISYDVVNSPEHAAHALLMAEQSMVLLKNNGILPLNTSEVKSIAVVGPNAHNEISVLGNYNGFPEDAITVYEGIKDKFSSAKVVNTKGTDYTLPLNTQEELAKIADCDIVVFVGGMNSMMEGEEGCVDNVEYEGFSKGDRTTIVLPRVQTEFMKKVKAAGKKLIYVNMSGSAVAMNWEDENADAVIQAWYGGQAAGAAVANILAGDYSPSGRLPLTFYASDSDLGDINDYSMKGRTYRYFAGKPLYGFGYGLSYTTFEYSSIKVKEGKDGNYSVSVKVKNTGSMAGDEVVQLYIRPDFSNELLPIQSLKEFTRVSLQPGKSTTVKFSLPKEAFSIRDDKGDYFNVAGSYSVCVGGGQPTAEALAAKGAIATAVAIK